MLIQLLLLASCSEYSYTSKIQKDVFQQVRRNTVDILLVIDDSCSMAEEQEKLSNNFESFISAFSGVNVDWQIGVTTTDTYRTEHPGRLIGGEDELILVDPEGRTIDEVKWDRDWPYSEGVAMQLSIDKYAPTSNTSIMNWCAATDEFGDGDLGTPGQPNNSCAANSPQPPSGDTGTSDTGSSEGDEPSDGEGNPIPPSVGDIIFSEVLMDASKVDDIFGEWIELTNLTTDSLDLSGYKIEDDGSNSFTFPENTFVEASATLLVGRSTDLAGNGGVEIDVVSENLTLNNKVTVLTANHPDVQENFEEMVVVGTSGSGIEMGLEAAKLALTEPLINTDNAGFIRPEANLSLIFVSDENDYSPSSAHTYLRAYSDIKGDEAYRDHTMVNVSAVVGMDLPPYEGEPSCVSGNGVGFYGPKYIELVNRTNGRVESICDEDFSTIASELGLVVSGLQLEFELSDLPDLDTLVVKLYAEESDDSLIGELVRNEDYTYIIENNSILFNADSLPQSETFILAEYRVLPTGAVITESTNENSLENEE
jgi:hypothetical protein